MGQTGARARRSQSTAGLVAVVVVAFFLAAATDHPPRTVWAAAAAAPSLPSPSAAPTGSLPTAPPGQVQRRMEPVTGIGEIALTFDDGPDPRWTPIVLDLLRRYRAPATFCLVGVHVRDHPELVRRIVAEGHTLCNHTWSHAMRLHVRPRSVVRQQLDTTQRAITTASGGVKPRYFRVPGGSWGPVVAEEAGRLGMTLLGWSVDPADWGKLTPKQISDRVLARAGPGAIVLLHDGYGDRAASVAALRVILPALLERGLRFRTP